MLGNQPLAVSWSGVGLDARLTSPIRADSASLSIAVILARQRFLFASMTSDDGGTAGGMESICFCTFARAAATSFAPLELDLPRQASENMFL